MALSAGSVYRDPDERIARLEDRYRNEDMSAEERCELRDRILKIKAAGRRAPAHRAEGRQICSEPGCTNLGMLKERAVPTEARAIAVVAGVATAPTTG